MKAFFLVSKSGSLLLASAGSARVPSRLKIANFSSVYQRCQSVSVSRRAVVETRYPRSRTTTKLFAILVLDETVCVNIVVEVASYHASNKTVFYLLDVQILWN